MLRSSSTKKFLSVLLTAGLVMSSFSYLAFADDEIIEDVADTAVEQTETVEEDKEEDVQADADVADDDENADAVTDDVTDGDEEAADEDSADEDVPADENVDEDVTEEISEEPVDEEAAEVPEDAEITDEDAAEQYADSVIDDTTSANVLIWKFETADHPVRMTNLSAQYFRDVGATVAYKNGGKMSASDLEGVDIVHLLLINIKSSSSDGQDIIASADVLKSFVEAGGKLILNGENGGYSPKGNATLMALGAAMGFEFDISGEYSHDNMIFNTAERPELSSKLSGFFKTNYIGVITSNDPDATWVAKDSYSGDIAIMDKQIGSGAVIVLSDYNYLESYTISAQQSQQLFVNIANATYPHHHLFEYAENGSKLTAKCIARNCDAGVSSASITIVAPTYKEIGGEGDATATLTGVADFEAYIGEEVDDSNIFYEGRGDTVYGKSKTAPTELGTYTASFVYTNASGEYEITVDYEIALPRLEFVDSDGQEFELGSDKTLTFHAIRSVDNEGLMNDLTGVLVDDNAVPEDAMELINGSVITTLKSGFLNGLSVGTHKFSLTFNDGRTLSINFKVKEAPKASPQTGEYAGPAVLAAATLLMAGGAVLALKARKREEV